jgi:hypothetical protein
MQKKETVTASAEPTTKGFSIEDHSPLKSVHMLALGMEQPIAVTTVEHKHGTEYYAEIPRKYLGVDSRFQRPLNGARVARMKRKWASQAYRPASVVECFFEGKYYYTVTDGQHRSAAYPEDPNVDRSSPNYNPEDQTVFVQLIKEMSPVASFVYSNDKSTTKTLSYDENFWAVKAGQDLGETGGPFDEFKYIEECFDVVRSQGWNPMRYSTRSQDAGTHASAIYKYWNEYGIPRIRHVLRKGLNDADLDVKANAELKLKFESVKVLRDTFTLMSTLLDPSSFSKDDFGGEFWAGVIDFLCNPDCMNNEYNIGALKRCLSHRVWADEFNGKSSEEFALSSIESLELGRAAFIGKSFANKNGKERSLNRTHLQGRQLVYHVFRTGMRKEGGIKNLNLPNLHFVKKEAQGDFSII